MASPLRSADELVNRVLSNEELLAKIKEDPKKELPKLAEEVIGMLPPIEMPPDVWIYRVVVGSLGFTVLSVVIGSMILTGIKIDTIPDLLTAIGSAAVGALAGLLAPSPVRK